MWSFEQGLVIWRSPDYANNLFLCKLNFNNIHYDSDQIRSNTRISVVICTYNRATYLDNGINSVINQTLKDWELIIVDDGSQDNTFKIVNPYVQQFPNIRYLKHQNKKQAYAKNAGIQASFGKYITILDSDDAYKPNHLASRLEYMKNHPEIDLIEGGFASEEEIFVADYFQPGQTINLRECVLGPTFFGKRKVFFELGALKISTMEKIQTFGIGQQKFLKPKNHRTTNISYTRAETSVSKSVSEIRSSNKKIKEDDDE